MFQYSTENLSAIRCDALVLDVDCVGGLDKGHLAKLDGAFPDVVAETKRLFDAGELEPGRILHLEREALGPSNVFLFPTRVHFKGEVRLNTIEDGIEQLTSKVLQLGINSIAMFPFESKRGLGWTQIKLLFLSSFARISDIQLIQLKHNRTDSAKKQVTIFCDGGAEPNPGVGGFGVVLRFGDHCRELSEGYQLTTNNRMELSAAIAGMEILKESCQVRLFSDSRYVVDTVNGGLLFRVADSKWQTGKAKNLDLWRRFLDAYLRHEVELVWVKGHAGIADNERCDQLASRAMKGKKLSVDEEFVRSQSKAARVASVQVPSATSKVGPKSAVPGAVAARGPKPKQVGDPCRHCSQPLVRRETKKHTAGAAYHYKWYLFCENCHRMYHVDAAKVQRSKPSEKKAE